MMEKLRQDASELIEDLEMPETIKTPGRRWTRFPEDLEKETPKEETTPEVQTDGETEVYTGEEALEAAGEKAFDLIKKDENRLNAIHASSVTSLIYVEASGDSELDIDYATEGSASTHLIIDVKPGSNLQVTERTDCGEFNTSFTEIYVGENASVDYGAVENPSGFSYSRRKAIVHRYGSINWLNGIFSGDLNRTRIDTVLKGDGSETEMTGVWYPTGEQHHDLSLQVRHIGDNTKCDMDSRSVVDDKARSLYEGLQKVERSATDTSSFQDQETLMLSQDAESDASPKLMIENPDVEASHAAAAGSVEKQKQHYLESRGLTSEEAEKLVVKGFFEPVMEQIRVPRVKSSIREKVREKLQETQV